MISIFRIECLAALRWLLLMAMLFNFQPTGFAAEGETLIFPNDRSFGPLYTIYSARVEEGIILRRPHFAVAKGIVKVPPDQKVRLELSYSGAEDPRALLKLKGNGLISIDCRGVDNFSDNTLLVVSQLKNLIELRLDTTEITDVGMASLKGMINLRDLNIEKTMITAAGISQLKGMTSLRRLKIGFNHLSDDSMVNLEALKVEFLSAPASQISDQGLSHLAKLKSLRGLDVFDNKKVTNRGMEYLTQLPALTHLSLYGTTVDTGALESFKKMKALKHLTLDGKRLTRSDLIELRKGLPGCEIAQHEPRGNIDLDVLSPLH